MQDSDQVPDGFEKVCLLSELQPGKGSRFIVNDEEVALFNIGGKVYALDNVCPHQHSPIIYNGYEDDNFIACPAHGWRFSLETGKKPDGTRGLTTYPVMIIEGTVYCKVIPKKFNW